LKLNNTALFSITSWLCCYGNTQISAV